MLGLPGLEYGTIAKVFFNLPSMWPTRTFIVTSPLNTIPPLTVFKYLLMDRFHFVFLRHGKSAGFVGQNSTLVVCHYYTTDLRPWRSTGAADTPRARNADTRQVLQLTEGDLAPPPRRHL